MTPEKTALIHKARRTMDVSLRAMADNRELWSRYRQSRFDESMVSEIEASDTAMEAAIDADMAILEQIRQLDGANECNS